MRFPKLTEERHSRQAGALARAKPSRGGARTNGSAVVACSAELLLSSTVSENPSAAESSMSPSICRLAPSRSECGIEDSAAEGFIEDSAAEGFLDEPVDLPTGTEQIGVRHCPMAGAAGGQGSTYPETDLSAHDPVRVDHCCAVPPAAAGMRLAPNSKTLVTSLRRGGEIDLTDAQADLLNQMNRHDRASTHWRARPDDGDRTHTEQTQSP